ncbi:FHA domain-containing protein DDL, partial [Paragonimus heterotremus]
AGKLTEDSNTYKGVVIKYNEPEDARKPTEHWRLYTFKGNKTLPILHIHRQSGFLIGRDRKIADIPMDHPNISKQHAVLQYRFVRGMVRLYLIDLESANGTYLNNTRIEPRRYYELLEKDLIKFGYSSREYVLMTAQLDEDDEQQEPEDPE